MNKRLYIPLAVMAIMALALSACQNPRADEAGVWYNPLSWGNQTLAASLEAGCAGGATSTVVANSTYRCPGDVEIYVPLPPPAPVAPTAVPVAVCTTQGIAITDGNNGMEAAPVGGAYEPCHIVAQIHGVDGLGYVVVLAPTQWLRLTAKGAAGWYVMKRNLEAEIANSVASIVARGEATPTVVRLDLNPNAAVEADMPGIVAGPFTGPLP